MYKKGSPQPGGFKPRGEILYISDGVNAYSTYYASGDTN